MIGYCYCFIWPYQFSQAQLLERNNQVHSWLPLIQSAQERLTTANDVAQYKWQKKLAITDPTREKQVITQQIDKAKQIALDVNYVKQVFEDQIIANKLIQHSLFLNWQYKSETKTDISLVSNKTDLPQLNQLRVKIDKLNNKLLKDLLKTVLLRKSSACQEQLNKDLNQFYLQKKIDMPMQIALIQATMHLCRPDNKI